MQARSDTWRGVGGLESAGAGATFAQVELTHVALTIRQSPDGLVAISARHRTGTAAVDEGRSAARSGGRATGAAAVDETRAVRHNAPAPAEATSPGTGRSQPTSGGASRPSYAVIESVVYLEPTVDTGSGSAEISAGASSVVVTGDVIVVSVPFGRFEIRLDWCRTGFRARFALNPDDHIYGLGEKTGPFDRRGRSFIMWNSDEPDHLPSADPLYQSIPFGILFREDQARGIFVDSPATIYVDAGEEDPETLSFEVYDETFDLYLMAGESLEPVLERYTELTGRIPLPPEWALGYHQSRYSYFPDHAVLKLAQDFRDRGIPCDAIHLDIHYMEGYRVFTWDRERFPNPGAVTRELRDKGFRTVTIVDPGVKLDPAYGVYESGLDQEVYLRDSNGQVYAGEVWPGAAVFPDFTSDSAQGWWAGWHRRLFDAGVSGVWNDMNEPADFTGNEQVRRDFTVPDNLIAENRGRPTSFGRVHNAYANGMNRATRRAFAELQPEERGFVLTRAGYAGIQRYAAVWTGDNHSWWEHLQLSVPMFLGMALSGVPFVGADVGGFQQNATADLYARWVASAAFTPFFRGHTALDTRQHEPWSFGAATEAVARRYVTLRYRLLPYLYSLFEESARTGHPIMRPLVYHFPGDPRVHRTQDSFLMGPAILVAPVVTAGADHRSVYLPAGRWYDFWTGLRVGGPDTGTVVAVEAPLDRIPVFVRGGSVVPFEGIRNHTGERGAGELSLVVAPDAAGTASGTLYADAGEGIGYQQGAYWRGHFTYGDGTLRVRVEHAGYQPRWSSVKIVRMGGDPVGDAGQSGHGILDRAGDAVFDFPGPGGGDAETVVQLT